MKVTGKAVQVQAGAGALTRLKERFVTWLRPPVRRCQNLAGLNLLTGFNGSA